MFGPATNERVELSLDMQAETGGERLRERPAGGTGKHKVRLTAPGQIDADLFARAEPGLRRRKLGIGLR